MTGATQHAGKRRSAVQQNAVREVAHCEDKLDTQGSRGGRRGKVIALSVAAKCQNANQLACQHTSANERMCFLSVPGGCKYITARRKRQSKPTPPTKSNNGATFYTHCWFGVTLSVNLGDGMRLCWCECWHFGFFLSEGLSARLSAPARPSSKCHLLKIHVNWKTQR